MAHQTSGSLLVGLQFTTLAAQLGLALATDHAPEQPLGPLLLAMGGLALGLWALAANRPGNFNIHPAPRDSGRLIDGGPYRWIRHPMYSALMLIGGALAWVTDSFPGWMLFLTLVCVLAIKGSLEEWLMTRAHADYAAYRARTRAFIPFLL